MSIDSSAEHPSASSACTTLELQRQLDACVRDLERLGYSVSHDLRAPLRAIDGYSRMIEEDYASQLDADGQRKLNIIRSACAQMNNMMDALLAYSRIGRDPVALRPLSMTAMARASFEQASAGSSQSPQLVLSPLPDAWGDADLIRAAWQHLLDNAVKFSAQHSDAMIEIGSMAKEDETVYFVRDNGAGFNMQYRDKLFGMFQRLHAPDEFPGSGTGLAFVYRIVQKHGGRVWAESEPGKGATFYFALPATSASDKK